MSRTCKRVVYKKVKRSCKNALVGGAGFFANNDNDDKVAVNKFTKAIAKLIPDAINKFTDAIAKLIPNKAPQNKIEASKYYESITINHNVFNVNICLYAFIILYCAIVHNFKIEPSKANKALIDTHILVLLMDAMIKLLIQDGVSFPDDVKQILASLENNKIGETEIISFLVKNLNININMRGAIKMSAHHDDDNNNNNDTEKIKNVNMNDPQKTKGFDEKLKPTRRRYGDKRTYDDTHYIITQMLITIPKPPKVQPSTTSTNNPNNPNKFNKFDNDAEGQALRQRIKAQQH